MQFCFRSKDLTWKKYFYILFEPNIKINQKEVKK